MIRQNIRAQIQTHLKDQTQAENRVYVGRKEPIAEDESYPAILIYSGQETVDRRSQQPFSLRTYNVVIEVRVQTIEDDDGSVDDEMDVLADEVETAMKVFSLAGVRDVSYLGCDPDVDNEGEFLLGSLKMNFEFKYIR